MDMVDHVFIVSSSLLMTHKFVLTFMLSIKDLLYYYYIDIYVSIYFQLFSTLFNYASQVHFFMLNVCC